MAGNPPPSNEPPSPSFWTAIGEVIKGLSKEPALLFSFGALIVILAAGALSLQNLRVVAAAILVVLVVGLAAWILLKALSLQSKAKSRSTVGMQTGGVKARGVYDVKGKVDIESGKNVVTGPAEGTMTTGKVDVNARITAGEDLIIKSGDNLTGPSKDGKGS
jgi:hypothetical protein